MVLHDVLIKNGCKKFKVFQLFSHTPLNRYKENGGSVGCLYTTQCSDAGGTVRTTNNNFTKNQKKGLKVLVDLT